MKKSHSYKEAVKRQFSVIVTALILLVAIGWEIHPINTPYKTFAFSLTLLIIGLGTLWFVRKSGLKVLCASCNTDIFEFVEIGTLRKTPVRFCPVCGKEVEI